MIGMDIVPRQLSELAVGQKLSPDVAGGGVERSRVKISPTQLRMYALRTFRLASYPGPFITHIDAADTQRLSQGPSDDLDALGMQAANDVLITGDHETYLLMPKS